MPEPPLFDQLKSERKKENAIVMDMKRKFYKECTSLVKTMNNIGVTQCIYKTPMVSLGYPVYDATDVTKYISNKLKKEKLKVKFLSKHELFISWA